MPSMTQVPLPKIRHLVFSLMRLPNDNEISSPWANSEDKHLWFSKSAQSLAVIVKCFKEIKQKKLIKVWVPDFFCFGSLKLSIDAEIELVFYSLNEDLSPDINNCEILAQNHDVDIFLHVHFFGSIVQATNSAKFAKDHGASGTDG